MATRFATATGVWSNTGIWDGGTLPIAGDTVHPNGFVVTIDQDVNIDGFNNNIPPVYLPGMPIPKMTGNTVPSGTVNAGSDTSNAWKGFDQDAPTPTTFWAGTGVGSGTAWLSYQFTAAKTIKRYYIYRTAQNMKPTSWVFQGSNDGSIWIDLETVTANALNTSYLSGILPNTTAYLYYRINITAVTSGTTANIYQFEMTESTATTYGTTTGGSFTVPNTLSGTRNIVQSGEGIKCNNAATVMTLAHTIGNTVNFNTASGGYILNPNSHTVNFNNSAIQINGNGAVNFNANIWGSQTVGITNVWGLIYINNNATVTINGNVYAGKGGTSTYKLITTAVTTSNSCVLNINGDIIGSNYYGASYPIAAESLATTNITGNLTADLGNCYYSIIGSFVNLTGTATVTNANSQAAIVMTSATSLLTINGSITNKNNVNTIMAPKIRFASTSTPYWIYQTNGASDMTLSYGTATGPYPVEADVKLGVAYAASPTRYGTCAVPLPQYVSQGVATGSTVGTAYINAADVWNILTSTITVSGSIGERLKVASTVETTGDQLAAYIV
jgi:hypothetical protein